LEDERLDLGAKGCESLDLRKELVQLEGFF
jgi:hypothetical protein